jgi:hypothetical protein
MGLYPTLFIFHSKPRLLPLDQHKFVKTIDLVQKSIFIIALAGLPAAEDGDESTYARSLIIL